MARAPHRIWGAGAAIGLAATAIFAIAGMPAAADPVCSVFSRHPCAPTVCSIFRRGPCIPEFEYPLGQDLRLTIESARTDTAHADRHQPDESHKLNSIKDLFAALRGCWVPPDESEAQPGMQMSVRFAFKRNGEIIGTPRVTYATPDTPSDIRNRYHTAITAALARCTPMPFTRGMGGAIAGRPIAIRFVDNRKKS